jgi:hypothetical protein
MKGLHTKSFRRLGLTLFLAARTIEGQIHEGQTSECLTS